MASERDSRFVDRFADVARDYAAFRPRYPDALFAWLASAAPARGLAWDCGAGSGQATIGLAAHFHRVVATDASAAQLALAAAHPRVEYRVAPADSSGLADRSVDLVAVAQAAHWFDLPRFYAEVRRVAVPRAVVALWMYNLLSTGDREMDETLLAFYRETLAGWWSPERRLIDEEYRTIPFPFEEIAAPAFEMHARWTLAHLVGYLRSWSAVASYREALGTDPVDVLRDGLAARWGDPAAEREIVWPLVVRAGRVGPS